MKPTKNTIYCYGCRRTKMLFETKAKADNFIRYNSVGIQEENGKAPVRSYYCGICGGYHVTSNPSATEGERLDFRDKQLIETVTRRKKEKKEEKKEENPITLTIRKRETKEAKVMAQTISDRIVRIKTLLMYGQLTDAEDLLDVCYLDLEEIGKYPPTVYSKLTSLKNKVEKTREMFIQVKEVLGLTEQEQQQYISLLPRDRKKFSLANILFYAFTVRRIEHLLWQAEELLDEGETTGASQAIGECRRMVVDISVLDKNKKTKSVNSRIQELERRLNRIKEEKKINESCKPKDSAEAADDEYTADKPSTPEDTGDHPSEPAQSKEYITTILLLIKKLEEIQKAYEEEDFDSCESQVEIACFILDDLDTEDENVKTIADQLDNWKQILGMS